MPCTKIILIGYYNIFDYEKTLSITQNYIIVIDIIIFLCFICLAVSIIYYNLELFFYQIASYYFAVLFAIVNRITFKNNFKVKDEELVN